MRLTHLPPAQGLYHPVNEKDSCGVGFVAQLDKKNSHQLLQDALAMLARMNHRGGCGCEENTGDGAGVLTNLPTPFFKDVIKQDFALDVEKGRFAVGNIFLPQEDKLQQYCINALESFVHKQGQQVVGWRTVPTSADKADIGASARAGEPLIKQLIIKAADEIDEIGFERALYLIHKQTSHHIHQDEKLAQTFYICSLSPKVIVYKGMLTGSQLPLYYADLTNPAYGVYLAMVHSRFSTNTFPSWDRAQPCRYMSHNGEINTRQGNYNWMSAREGMLSSEVFGKDLAKILPVIEKDVSDSGGFDNVLEFLLMNGLSLQEAVLMMIPEAWQNDANMSADKKAFYEYFSTKMEPWDGPASITFTDGEFIGAILDRNGLRPSRYYVTRDKRIIMASEVGVVDVEPVDILSKGRLQPGRLFLVDFNEGLLLEDDEIKHQFASRRPYQKWLTEQSISLAEITTKQCTTFDETVLIQQMNAFGYTTEVIEFMLIPLVNDLRDPLGSMGNDAALACLSDKPRRIYDYFKQLFAQVTNPPIDSIREEVVMSLKCYIGPEANLLEHKADNAHRLLIDSPILTNEELFALKHINHRGWQAHTIDITCDIKTLNLAKQLDDICLDAERAITKGCSVIVLSDRSVNEQKIAIGSLLAASAVHQHLVKQHIRTKTAIIVETAEASQVHHFCVLTGFGIDAINPYLAFEVLAQAAKEGRLKSTDRQETISRYRQALNKGMLKVMAKMGISTLASYKGAQIFEALGLAQEVMDKCFCGTISRLKGIGFEVLQQEAIIRHQKAHQNIDDELENSGDFHWRVGGENHMWNPETIFSLQQAAQNDSKQAYETFVAQADASTAKSTLRGLMSFKPSKAIALDEVEPVSEIVKRFATGAMSFGSISQEAHEGLAIAMNRIGGKSNTGEGGESADRWRPDSNGDLRRSAIKQVASGRFGVTIDYLNNADEIQIKIAQGAKPGEGGELPGSKVDENIAGLRHSTPGVGLISPPPHHDIYSIEDLAQLIFDLKRANENARISVKLVAAFGVGTIAAGVVKGKADHVVIAGHDGGTGASPLTSIKHAGLPWELGIAETHQTLMLNGLRSRVVLQTDGQLKTGKDVAVAFLLGAEEVAFSTAPLITMGCIMMRKCHLNTCPVGIATQDKVLRKKFKGKPEYIINYLFMLAEELRGIMAKLGFSTVNEMVGRADKLQMDPALDHWKAKHLDLSPLLMSMHSSENTPMYHTESQNHQLTDQLDRTLFAPIKQAIETGVKANIDIEVSNINRTVGAMLSSYLLQHKLAHNLENDAVTINMKGTAGQSLGAFLTKGITLKVEGDANDYVAKGLSGGKVAVFPPKASTFNANEHIIAGNVCCYGAIAGEVYLCGQVAERFCVRNSGASVVVEGVGDHGCEYMTGGKAVILGEVGRNFAAGMSGGVAYVYDLNKTLYTHCNTATVALETLDDEAQAELLTLIKNHHAYTGSCLAATILANWQMVKANFVKVMPIEYKKALQKQAKAS